MVAVHSDDEARDHLAQSGESTVAWLASRVLTIFDGVTGNGRDGRLCTAWCIFLLSNVPFAYGSGLYCETRHITGHQKTANTSATMRFFLSTFILALLVALALAAAPQHPIVVSYPAGTPNSVLEEAKAAIIKAVWTTGGSALWDSG